MNGESRQLLRMCHYSISLRQDSSIAGDQGVAGAAESLLSYDHKLFLHQHVVGVVSRYGENGNAVMGEGFDAESNTPVCEKGNGLRA